MGKGYKHLTWHDRLKIAKMKNEGRKQVEIAHALHVSESTISRELRRSTYEHLNSDLTTEIRYNPDGAQQRYEYNKTAKGAPLKIGNDHALAAYIETKIADEKYSPCAVLAEIENDPDLQFSVTICRATLYKYIDQGVFLRITNCDLPFRGKRRKHRKTRKVRAARPSCGESIEKRPDHINDRSEFGHWEQDLVDGCRGSKSNALVLTERQTRQEITVKIPDKTTDSVVARPGQAGAQVWGVLQRRFQVYHDGQRQRVCRLRGHGAIPFRRQADKMLLLPSVQPAGTRQ